MQYLALCLLILSFGSFIINIILLVTFMPLNNDLKTVFHLFCIVSLDCPVKHDKKN